MHADERLYLCQLEWTDDFFSTGGEPEGSKAVNFEHVFQGLGPKLFQRIALLSLSFHKWVFFILTEVLHVYCMIEFSVCLELKMISHCWDLNQSSAVLEFTAQLIQFASFLPIRCIRFSPTPLRPLIIV
jgi:hypothetical protein